MTGIAGSLKNLVAELPAITGDNVYNVVVEYVAKVLSCRRVVSQVDVQNSGPLQHLRRRSKLYA